MKYWFINYLILLTMILSVHGYIGENSKQIQNHFGKPRSMVSEVNPSEKTFVYTNEGLRILVTYRNGLSNQEVYSKLDAMQPFSDTEIAAILSMNGKGYQWQKVPTSDWNMIIWRRADGQASAFYRPNDNPSILTVRFALNDS